MGSQKGQLTVRGMVIGAVGSAVITASSLYIALKLGALPWPIVFAALVSFFFLRLLGKTSLNEVNVTHTAMSAGAMVAGGLAFTIPGYWILGGTDEVAFWQVLLIAVLGVALGLVATACVRRYFIDEAGLAFPIGVSAAETLRASDEVKAKESKALFGSMGIAAVYAVLRDNLSLLPAMLLNKVSIPGVAFGIYNSPMMLGVGFIIGPVACLVWFLGALIGDFGIVVGGTAAGAWDLAAAQGIKTSLGMGLMFGSGIGVVLMQLVSAIRRRSGVATENAAGSRSADTRSASSARSSVGTRSAGTILSNKTSVITASLVSAVVAALAALLLGLGLVPSILLVLGAWVAVLISSQSVGVSGIDPMEVFGVLVLLIILIFCHDLSTMSLFFVAAIVACASGLTGDVMNDFKAGAILGTDPRAQWIAQAIGGLVGALVASTVLLALVTTFGTDSFGVGKEFVAAQASVVAAMVGGVPNMAAFIIGIVVGLVLAVLKLPCMTLGLGVYLPFYLSLTAFLGAIAKFVYDKITGGRVSERTGVAIASGLLGGESLVGVLSALLVMALSLV
jgi:putative OPT family oligopeptide transporter